MYCMEKTCSEELVPLISFNFQQLIGNIVPFSCERTRTYWKYINFIEEHERFFSSNL